MKPIIEFLSNVADRAFMTPGELADEVQASDLDSKSTQAFMSQISSELNASLSNKAINQCANASIAPRAIN